MTTRLFIAVLIIAAQAADAGTPSVKFTVPERLPEYTADLQPDPLQKGNRYRFSSATTNSDPGEGNFRYSKDALNGPLYIYIDDFDLSGEDQSNWYIKWRNGLKGTGKIKVSIVEINGRNTDVFYVKGVFGREKGYWRIPAEYVSGTLPADGDIYFFEISEEEIPEQGSLIPANAGQAPLVNVPAAVPEAKPSVSQAEPVQVPDEPQQVQQPLQNIVSESKPELVPDQAEPVARPEQLPVAARAEAEPLPVHVPEPIPVPEQAPEPSRAEAEPLVVNVPEPVPVPDQAPEPARAMEEQLPDHNAEPVKATETAPEPLRAQAENPQPENRSRPVKSGQQTTRQQSPQQNTVRREAQPIAQSQPAKTEPVAKEPQPKSSTQTTRTPQQTTVKKEVPVSQPAPESRQQQTRPAQPATRSTQTSQTSTRNTQPSPSAPSYPSTGGTVYNSMPSFRNSDGSRLWHGIIEAGYGLKAGDYGINNFRIDFIGSISLGQHFMLGLGLGYRNYFDKPDKHPDWYLVSGKSQVPVFLDMRFKFSKKRLTPFIALGVGGTTETSKVDTTKHGSFINPSAGLWLRLGKNSALFADIAYEGLGMEYASPVDNIPFRRKNSSVSLNIGIQF